MKYRIVFYSSIFILVTTIIFWFIAKHMYMNQKFTGVERELKTISESLDKSLNQIFTSLENIFNSADIEKHIEDYLSGKISSEGFKRNIVLKISDNSSIFNNLVGMIFTYQDKVILEVGETSFLKKRFNETKENFPEKANIFKDNNITLMVCSIQKKFEKAQIMIISLFDISNLVTYFMKDLYYYTDFGFYSSRPKASRYGYAYYLSSVDEYMKIDLKDDFLLEGFDKYFIVFAAIFLSAVLFSELIVFNVMKKHHSFIEKTNEREYRSVYYKFKALNNLIKNIASEKSDWNDFCKNLTVYLDSKVTFIGLSNSTDLEILGSFDIRKNSPFEFSKLSSNLLEFCTDNTAIYFELKQLKNYTELSKTLDINEKSIVGIAPIYVKDKLIGAVVTVYENNEKVSKEAENFLSDIVQLIDEKIEHVLDMKESRKTRKIDVDQELLKMAMFDQLTKVPNRRYLELKLKSFFKDFKSSNKRFGLIFFDIDNFKKFNDVYGHDCGDMVLITTGKILKKVFRANDIFGRWGGEEFLVIVDDVDEDAIAISAERLRKTVESTLVNCENQSLKVTISIGATVVKENDTIENILKRVDELMYQAKQSGKNTVVVG